MVGPVPVDRRYPQWIAVGSRVGLFSGEIFQPRREDDLCLWSVSIPGLPFFFSPVAVSLSGAAPKARTPLDRRHGRQTPGVPSQCNQPLLSGKKALVLFVSNTLHFARLIEILNSFVESL
jgi:hypothetical protein